MMDGIKEIADGFGAELKRRLPKQRKTQRTKLALLVATMLDVRSANLMELAAGLPREADRTGPLGNAQRYMRYQWISRLLGNPLVVSDEIMEPVSRAVLERAASRSWVSTIPVALQRPGRAGRRPPGQSRCRPAARPGSIGGVARRGPRAAARRRARAQGGVLDQRAEHRVAAARCRVPAAPGSDAAGAAARQSQGEPVRAGAV
jgi:hypothetical protein